LIRVYNFNMKKLIWLVILMFGMDLMICLAQEENRPVQSLKMWEGTGLSEQILSQSTGGPYISNKQDFEKMWKVWRSDKMPKIDFKKNLIVLCVTLNPNNCFLVMKLTKGDLKLSSRSTLIGSNEKLYNYKIVLIERAGIKTINGQPIKK
jgi:hypothetical protein